MSQPTQEADTIQLAVTALQGWEQDIDAVQRAKLTAARRRALSPAPAARRAPLAWGGALAAALLLVLSIGLWPAMQSARNGDVALLQATLEDSTSDTPEPRTAELLLDDDLDFYLWLDGNSASADST